MARKTQAQTRLDELEARQAALLENLETVEAERERLDPASYDDLQRLGGISGKVDAIHQGLASVNDELLQARQACEAEQRTRHDAQYAKQREKALQSVQERLQDVVKMSDDLRQAIVELDQLDGQYRALGGFRHSEVSVALGLHQALQNAHRAWRWVKPELVGIKPRTKLESAIEETKAALSAARSRLDFVRSIPHWDARHNFDAVDDRQADLERQEQRLATLEAEV